MAQNRLTVLYLVLEPEPTARDILAAQHWRGLHKANVGVFSQNASEHDKEVCYAFADDTIARYVYEDVRFTMSLTERTRKTLSDLRDEIDLGLVCPQVVPEGPDAR